MMNVLASNGGPGGLSVDRGSLGASIAELSTLFFQAAADGGVVAMIDVTLLNLSHGVLVLFRKHLTLLDRLDGGVVMILMNLTVWSNPMSARTNQPCRTSARRTLTDGGLNLIVTGLLDGLVHDGRGDPLVDSGVMMTSLVPGIGRRLSPWPQSGSGRRVAAG